MKILYQLTYSLRIFQSITFEFNLDSKLLSNSPMFYDRKPPAHVLAGHLSSGPALLLKTCGTNNSENNNCTTMKIFSSSFCLQMQWKLVSNLNSAPRGPLTGPPQAPLGPPVLLLSLLQKLFYKTFTKSSEYNREVISDLYYDHPAITRPPNRPKMASKAPHEQQI